MNILSPMPKGNGAYVLHKQLESRLRGYGVLGYSPLWTLLPVTLRWFARGKSLSLIHTALDYALFFKRKDIPLVVTIHNYVLDAFMAPYSSRLQRLHYRTDLRWFTRASLKMADRVTAVSKFAAERLQQDLQQPTRIQVIYNGIDEQRFRPSARPRRGQKPFRILFCGNLSRRKRADLITPLARSLGKDFEIRYTSGLADGRVPSNHQPPPENLVALGQIPYEKMHELYHSVDALFMPSVREGFGLCVAEAMACGLPVVAANASALPELVEHEKGGWLCPIDDVDAYARAFRALADSTADAKVMGEFNRGRVERLFTLQRMVAEYRLLFEEVLDNVGKDGRHETG